MWLASGDALGGQAGNVLGRQPEDIAKHLFVMLTQRRWGHTHATRGPRHLPGNTGIDVRPGFGMLYDLDYSDPANPIPRFFDARLVNGVLDVPDWNSEAVRG